MDRGAPLFVVFDTCTQAEYYADVHRVLALPEGAVLRYEYKRYLWTSEAANAIETFIDAPVGLPADALLMYGQKRDFKQGDPDPDEMLRWDDSVFVPTRSARIVSAKRTVGSSARSDVLHIDLQMQGFVNPKSDAVENLVRALEATDSLPFGDRDSQYNWVSLLPGALQASAVTLISDDQRYWQSVVDELVTLPTQFQADVFWRLTGIREARRLRRSSGAATMLAFRDRDTDEGRRRDYPLDEAKKYEICIQTHAATGRAQQFPGNATIAVTPVDDDEGLIKLSPSPIQLRPDATATQRFSISSNNYTGTRYTGIRLDTQISSTQPSVFPVGATCSVSFAIRKQWWRLVASIILFLGAVVLGGFLGAADNDLDPLIQGLGWGGVAVLATTSAWLFNKQFKLIAKTD